MHFYISYGYITSSFDVTCVSTYTFEITQTTCYHTSINMSGLNSISSVSFASFGSNTSDLEKKSKKCCTVDPMTHAGRQNQRFQMTSIPMIPVMILTVQTIYYFVFVVQETMEAQSLKKKVSR